MKQPRRPTPRQKKLIARAGLDPEKWLVRFKDEKYLHVIDKGIEQRETKIIDKETGKIIKRPSDSKDGVKKP